MKLLPLEPGCLAWLITDGMEVTIQGRGKAPKPCNFCGSMTGAWNHTPYHVNCECVLMRLDGGDFSKERESEKVREKA